MEFEENIAADANHEEKKCRQQIFGVGYILAYLMAVGSDTFNQDFPPGMNR